MLVYHQVINCVILANQFMCQMHSRMARLKIKELPILLAEDPVEKTRTIIVNDPLNLNQPLIIPLMLKGATSYFPSRRPKSSEYKDESIPRIYMTSEAPVWEPSDVSFAEQEYSNIHAMVIHEVQGYEKI